MAGLQMLLSLFQGVLIDLEHIRTNIEARGALRIEVHAAQIGMQQMLDAMRWQFKAFQRELRAGPSSLS